METGIRRGLDKAGFKDIRLYGNILGKKCKDSDYTICILAKKDDKKTIKKQITNGPHLKPQYIIMDWGVAYYQKTE